MITAQRRPGQEIRRPPADIVAQSVVERTSGLRQIVVLGQMVMLVLIAIVYFALGPTGFSAGSVPN